MILIKNGGPLDAHLVYGDHGYDIFFMDECENSDIATTRPVTPTTSYVTTSTTTAASTDVIIISSDEHVKRGGSASFTCKWTLNEIFVEDYDEDNFELYWKLEHTDGTCRGSPCHSIATIVSWDPAGEWNGEPGEPVYYLNHVLEDRISVVANFDGKFRY